MTAPAPRLDRTLFRKSLTAHTSADDWSRWFKDIEVSLTSSEILLQAPSRFVASQVSNRFLSQVESAAKSAGADQACRVRVTVKPLAPTARQREDLAPGQDPSGARPTISDRSTRSKPAAPTEPGSTDSRLRHPSTHYRFDNFEVGSSNLFAYAAASSVAENPGDLYNPLFIYGGSGLGKTHLLLAIAHRARRRFPGLTVRYCTSEGFVQEFIRSVSKRQMDAFRRRFREIDMLLIDDFQFLQGKEQSLEEFFWTFDSLHSGGGQVVLGCDRPPRDLDSVATRTRSRISAGLIAELVPPGFEARMSILRRLQEQSATPLEDNVLSMVATHLNDNVRDLVAALQQLQAYAQLTDRPVTAEAALRQLAPMSGLPPLRQTPETIIAACAAAFETTVDEILHHNRRPIPSAARQVAMYLVREVTGLPLARIGVAFNRGHSTILSAHRRVVAQISSDPAFAQRVTAIYDAVHTP